MGIYKSFNETLGKWQWKFCGGVKYYDTETECDADKGNIWELHNRNLEAQRFTANMLATFR